MNKYILFIFLIILFLLNIFFPYLIKNVLGIFEVKQNKEEEIFDVVIAHYKEDLSWVDKMLPKNCRIFIYTKSNEKPNCKRNYIHKYLKNNGREGNTYLYHIIENYNNKLNKNTLFLPGSCDLLYKKINLYLILKNIGKYKFNSVNLINNKILIYGDNYFLLNPMINRKSYCSTYKKNKHKDCKLIFYKFKNINEFKKYFNLNNNYICYNGIFSIKTNIIYNRKKNYYIELFNHLNNGDNALNNHFLERNWYNVFQKV